MKRLIIAIIFMVLPFIYHSFAVDFDKEKLARWYINYGNYLIDVGKYMEALENFETAFEMSSLSSTKSYALLAQANVLSTFLDSPEKALTIYKKIEKEFPQKRELALYKEGFLLFTLGRKKEAKEVLEKYLNLYPNGTFRFQVEVLLEKLSTYVPKPPKLEVRPKIRVRLYRGSRIVLEGEPVCNDIIGCNKEVTIQTYDGRRVLEIITSHNKRILSSSSKVCFNSPNGIIVKGRRSKKVRGEVCVELYGNKLMVINVVDIEDYLLSVVPSESYPSWPLETLKAQAVAARTYAYYQILHRKNRPYDVVDNESDQAYGGMEKETPRTTKAVRDTEGEILMYAGKPILAMYTANSGGYTADPLAIFGISKPYLKAKPDPESLKGKMARWEKRFSLREIERRLRSIGIKVGTIKAIEPVERGPSGRIIKVGIVTDTKYLILRTRTTLKRVLKLPDILLSIRRKGDILIFKGRGFGHGVGYSQWGAAFMGKYLTYKDILRFYYPGTKLKKLW